MANWCQFCGQSGIIYVDADHQKCWDLSPIELCESAYWGALIELHKGGGCSLPGQ